LQSYTNCINPQIFEMSRDAVSASGHFAVGPAVLIHG
jgi:hypothetical protein